MMLLKTAGTEQRLTKAGWTALGSRIQSVCIDVDDVLKLWKNSIRLTNFKLAVDFNRFVVRCAWPHVLCISLRKYWGSENERTAAALCYNFIIEVGKNMGACSIILIIPDNVCHSTWIMTGYLVFTDKGLSGEDIGEVEEESWRKGELWDGTYHALTFLNPWTC